MDPSSAPTTSCSCSATPLFRLLIVLALLHRRLLPSIIISRPTEAEAVAALRRRRRQNMHMVLMLWVRRVAAVGATKCSILFLMLFSSCIPITLSMYNPAFISMYLCLWKINGIPV